MLKSALSATIWDGESDTVPAFPSFRDSLKGLHAMGMGHGTLVPLVNPKS